MAGFEGWWVNGKTGKGMHVAEHWMEVRSDPEKFGLTGAQTAKILKDAGGSFLPGDTSPDGARGMLIKAAMSNGWVRVRGYRGKYSIQTCGQTASLLPKVLAYLQKNGVSRYSEIVVSDLASNYHQTFVDGMHDIHRELKHGKIPDIGVPAAEPVKKEGIPSDLSDKQARVMMRQRLGQKTHIPDPSPDDDMLPESKSLSRGLKQLLG